MTKFMSFGDVILIAFSAFIVIWGANMLLRNLNLGEYQA